MPVAVLHAFKPPKTGNNVMAYLYKTFQAVRTALCLGFLLLSLLIAPHARAQVNAAPSGSLFTVENVVVDVTADNALKAREQAFEEAQVKAFTELAGRMLPEAGPGGYTPPSAAAISPMILDYEVTNEKLSSKRYIGTYTFRFSDSAVSRYFDGRGVRDYRTAAPQPLLILPFLEQEGRTMLWSPYNLWLKAWAEMEETQGGTSYIVPIGDLNDIADIGDNDSTGYKRESVSRMLGRYGAGEVVIAIARPAEDARSLDVELFRTDHGRSEYVGRITQPLSGGENISASYGAAARRVAVALALDWKNGMGLMADSAPSYSSSGESSVPSTYTPGSVSVRAAYASLPEWAGIQRALARTSGISDIALRALSPREAFLDIAYQGDIEHLKLALAQSGLALTGPNQRPGIATLFYDLTPRTATAYPQPSAYDRGTSQESYQRRAPQAAPQQPVPPRRAAYPETKEPYRGRF
ncbi:MAG: DUF2066 domain-containing protein [Alphaproteobacteria bacterium]|nr:DUF2066 domain-containing protein [Alphaproteobacteria bacterium]